MVNCELLRLFTNYKNLLRIFKKALSVFVYFFVKLCVQLGDTLWAILQVTKYHQVILKVTQG
jgi:hypothetical protein